VIGPAEWLPALLLCAALAGVAWRLRVRAQPPDGAGLKVLAQTPLGPGQRLIAVRAADRVYLLAATQQGVQRIGAMDAARWRASDAAPPAQSLSLARGAGN
jgi:flagellar biogenesis protein FliO